MIDHHSEVSAAHGSDDLLFGTVESWVLYVRSYLAPSRRLNHFRILLVVCLKVFMSVR